MQSINSDTCSCNNEKELWCCKLPDYGSFHVFFSILCRIYPPEHFKKKYALDNIGYTDEVCYSCMVHLRMLWRNLYFSIWSADSWFGKVKESHDASDTGNYITSLCKLQYGAFNACNVTTTIKWEQPFYSLQITRARESTICSLRVQNGNAWVIHREVVSLRRSKFIALLGGLRVQVQLCSNLPRTVEPPNKGRLMTSHFVPCREAVLSLHIGKLAFGVCPL